MRLATLIAALLVATSAHAVWGGDTDESVNQDQHQGQAQGQLQGQAQQMGQDQGQHQWSKSDADATGVGLGVGLGYGEGGDASSYAKGGKASSDSSSHSGALSGSASGAISGSYSDGSRAKSGSTSQVGDLHGGEHHLQAGDATTGPVSTTNAPTTNITTKNRSLQVNLAMAPVNINDCMTASHTGGGTGAGSGGFLNFQWAGINKSCFAQKMAEAEDDLHTQVMLKCSIPTYRDAVAFEISPTGTVSRVKGNKQVHCIQRELDVANTLLANFEEYVNEVEELRMDLEAMQGIEGYDDSELRKRLRTLEAVAHRPNQGFLLDPHQDHKE